MREFGPWVMQDTDTKREWLFAETPRYYLHRDTKQKWVVMDRWEDTVVGDRHLTRTGAIHAFYKSMGRPLPETIDLPVFKGSSFEGV